MGYGEEACSEASSGEADEYAAYEAMARKNVIEPTKRVAELARRAGLVYEGDHDGRLSLRLEDPLLEALIKEHPEKDPANVK